MADARCPPHPSPKGSASSAHGKHILTCITESATLHLGPGSAIELRRRTPAPAKSSGPDKSSPWLPDGKINEAYDWGAQPTFLKGVEAMLAYRSTEAWVAATDEAVRRELQLQCFVSVIGEITQRSTISFDATVAAQRGSSGMLQPKLMPAERVFLHRFYKAVGNCPMIRAALNAMRNSTNRFATLVRSFFFMRLTLHALLQLTTHPPLHTLPRPNVTHTLSHPRASTGGLGWVRRLHADVGIRGVPRLSGGPRWFDGDAQRRCCLQRAVVCR